MHTADALSETSLCHQVWSLILNTSRNQVREPKSWWLLCYSRLCEQRRVVLQISHATSQYCIVEDMPKLSEPWAIQGIKELY